MSDIHQHHDTSISNDQEQVDQLDKKTNASSVNHREPYYNVDGEHRVESKTIHMNETFESSENDFNNARQHSEFENKDDKNGASGRVSQLITVKGRGRRTSIRGQYESTIPEEIDEADTESDSEAAGYAPGVIQKEENEQIRSAAKMMRESPFEIENKFGGEKEKCSKEIDPCGEPTFDQKEDKVKHTKCFNEQHEDIIDVRDMKDNFSSVSHHDWSEHVQVNDLDKQGNNDNVRSVIHTAENDEKEDVDGSVGSVKETSAFSQRQNKERNDSERDNAIDLHHGNTVMVKPSTQTGDANQQGEREIHLGNEKRIPDTIIKDNCIISAENLKDPSTKQRNLDQVNERFGIVEEERTEEDRSNNNRDLNTGNDGSRLLENLAMQIPILNKDENVHNDKKDDSLRASYVCENNNANTRVSPVDKQLIEGSEITQDVNRICRKSQKENSYFENHENMGTTSPIVTSRYSSGKKDYRRDEQNHISNPSLNEAAKEKIVDDDALIPQDGQEGSSGSITAKHERLQIIVNKHTQGYIILPRRSLTTILVSRDKEERKRQGNAYDREKRPMQRGGTKVKSRIGSYEKKRDGSGTQTYNYEEGRRIGGAAIAPFTKQYKHKKHIENVLEEYNYRSDGEANDKRKPEKSPVLDRHTGNVRPWSQRGHLFKVPRLKRNTQGRPIGGYFDDPFGPTEQEEVEASILTLDDSIDYNNISVKRISSSRQYLRERSARDRKKDDTMTAKTVVFDVPEDVEAMSKDSSEVSELRTRCQRDITSAMRRKLRDRLFTRSMERSDASPNYLPLGSMTKNGWVQTDSNTMVTGERSIVDRGRFPLNPLFRVYRQPSPTWSSSTSLSYPGKHARGHYSRSIGELSFEMEQQSKFEQGVETYRNVSHIADETKMPTNEHNMSNHQWHSYLNCNPLQLLSDDGRLIVREKGCPDIKSSEVSSWGHNAGGYGTSLSRASTASVRLQHNRSHIMESYVKLQHNGGDTNTRNIMTRSQLLNSTRLSDNDRLRRLLEELFRDKIYLDHLIETIEPKGDTLMITRGIAEHGREFLMERAEFWDETGSIPPRPATIPYVFRRSRVLASFRDDKISISTLTPGIRQHSIAVTLAGSFPSEKQ
ncbi:hypothetical protein ACJMK2_032609 [Sinanodonta woodiana]|uniref:Uncharacterized protein n=1 Tax=Sinanodonta woodiana TaxID=1069815 RepID=A0ABD3X3R5_SINWO